MSTRWVALPNLEYAYRKLAKTKFIYVANTSHCGAGIFAAKRFQSGQVILRDEDGDYYSGAINYAQVCALGIDMSRFCFQIDRDKFLLSHGSIDDLINHSCRPNAGIRLTTQGYDLLALSDIDVHNELTYKLSRRMSDSPERMSCNCGSVHLSRGDRALCRSRSSIASLLRQSGRRRGIRSRRVQDSPGKRRARKAMNATHQVISKSVMPGIGFILLAWMLFALHDASIKLLVANLSAWQVLFVRSLIVLPACLMLRRRTGVATEVPPLVRGRLVVNALIYALAWIAYYTAARSLQLAELETVYYASPIVTTVLAAVFLRESVPLSRWSGLAIGFLGVLLACGPTGLSEPVAIGLALIGAVLWAYSVVMIRQLSASVSTPVQMVINNTVFLILCAITMLWWWEMVSGREILLMAFVGLAGLVAQYLLYEGLRCTPASLAAPLEYTGLPLGVRSRIRDLARRSVDRCASGCRAHCRQWRRTHSQRMAQHRGTA